MIRSHEQFSSMLWAIAAASLTGFGCSSGGPAESNEANTGSAVLHLQGTPASELCLQVTVVGATRTETRNIDLKSEAANVTENLNGLPIGLVTFTGAAYGVACSQVGATTSADYVSDPVTTTISNKYAAEVMLNMKLNGKVLLGANWEDAGAPTCSPVDIALGASTAESDPGWGGGSYPNEVVDGITCYADWAHGLAFTGGTGQYMGDPCGWRQVTVDFGHDRQLTGEIDIYHHGLEHVPNTAKIEVLASGAWVEVFSTTSEHDFMRADTCTLGSIPTDHNVGPVIASKVRYSLNNCDITHGWIWEVVVQGCGE